MDLSGSVSSWSVVVGLPPYDTRAIGQRDDGTGVLYEGPTADAEWWEDAVENKLKVTRPPRGVRGWGVRHRVTGPSFWLNPVSQANPQFINLHQEWVLRSITADYEWTPGEQIGPAGDWISSQGIHKYGGFHSCKVESDDLTWITPVFGVVSHSGTVIEHERGFRSSRATIEALWVRYDEMVGGIHDLAESLEKRYEVTVYRLPSRSEDDPKDLKASVYGHIYPEKANG